MSRVRSWGLAAAVRPTPAKPGWRPEASHALSPLFDIQAEGFCPVRTDLVWFSQEAPLFASQVWERWLLKKWH